MGDEEIGPKSSYERVALSSNEDDEEEEEEDGIFIDRREENNNEDDNGSFVTASQSVVLMNGTEPRGRRRRTLFPDDVLQIGGVRIVEGTFSIKFAKFLFLTYLGVFATFYVVRYMVRYETKEKRQRVDVLQLLSHFTAQLLLCRMFFFSLTTSKIHKGLGTPSRVITMRRLAIRSQCHLYGLSRILHRWPSVATERRGQFGIHWHCHGGQCLHLLRRYLPHVPV
jgi:hypothetical protein